MAISLYAAPARLSVGKRPARDSLSPSFHSGSHAAGGHHWVRLATPAHGKLCLEAVPAAMRPAAGTWSKTWFSSQ